MDLRDEGILKGLWLVGPSPDIAGDAELLGRSEQAAKSVIHLRTGDAIQIVYSRRPATPPPALNYAHPAAAIVMAEMREKFVREEHWVTLTRGYLSHQYERPLKNTIRAMMSGGSEPQRLNNHDLLCQQALGRFQSMQDGLTNIVGLQPMTSLETFRSLLYHVTYRDLPAPLPEPHVRLNRVIACDWQVNGEKPMMGEWHLRPIVITLIAANVLILILSSIYFFAVPIVLSGLAAACLAVSWVRLSKPIGKPNP